MRQLPFSAGPGKTVTIAAIRSHLNASTVHGRSDSIKHGLKSSGSSANTHHPIVRRLMYHRHEPQFFPPLGQKNVVHEWRRYEREAFGTKTL